MSVEPVAVGWLRWERVVAIDCGVGGVCPVFDIGTAGEEQGSDGLADDTNGALSDAVELVDVGWCEVALNCRVVAEFEETG